MTVIVEVALSAGVVIDPQYLRLGSATLGLIGTGKIADEDVLANYSSRLMSMSTQRTSTRKIGPVVEYNAATATVVLLNDDGLLDPSVMAEIAPGSILRIRKLYNGVVYPIFFGYIDSWLPEHRFPTHSAVTVTATDGMSRIAGYRRTAVTPVGAHESSGARIGRILDSVGWVDARSIATGNTTLQATDMDGDALNELQEVVVAEVGEFYIKTDGTAYFRNRSALTTDTRSTTPQGAFGTNVAGGELPYVGTPELSYDRTQLVNSVTATRVGGAEQYVEDATSITRYGDHPHQQTDLMLEDDTAALSWASYVLQQDRNPQLRFTSLDFDGRIYSDLLMPHLLGREFGDRVTVVRRPPGGITDSRELIIRSIAHTWSPPDKWLTSWGLAPADESNSFLIGDASRGVIGTSAIGF